MDVRTGCPAQDVPHRMSRTGCPVQDVPYRMSRTGCPHRMSRTWDVPQQGIIESGSNEITETSAVVVDQLINTPPQGKT
jgi:hypothetical protein